MTEQNPNPVVVAVGTKGMDAALAYAEATRVGCGLHLLHVVHVLAQSPEMVLADVTDYERVGRQSLNAALQLARDLIGTTRSPASWSQEGCPRDRQGVRGRANGRPPAPRPVETAPSGDQIRRQWGGRPCAGARRVRARVLVGRARAGDESHGDGGGGRPRPRRRILAWRSTLPGREGQPCTCSTRGHIRLPTTTSS